MMFFLIVLDFDLIVWYKVDFLVVIIGFFICIFFGVKILLICFVIGNLILMVLWRKGGKVLSIFGLYLIIFVVDFDDVGLYICVVINIVGLVEVSLDIVIEGVIFFI